LDTLYRNNETNNYAEASIRIIKDVILNRTTAYNAVALVDFIVHVGEEYQDHTKNQAVETVSQEWNILQNMIPSLPTTILEKLCTRLKNT